MTVNRIASSSLPRTGTALLTGEGLLYGVVLAVAAGLRFLDLAALPLTPGEASGAWAAWLDVSLASAPANAVLAPASALLYALQRLTFTLLDAGDGLARFFPALAGTGMALLPWWLRGRLGRIPALLVALLIAVDPWLMVASRQAESAILSLALGLLLLVGLVRMADGERGRWPLGVAVAAGLFLVSGPAAWSLLPVLLWAGFLLVRRQAADFSPLWNRHNLLALAATGLLTASVGLLHPAGLTAVGSSLGVWLGHFGDQGYPLAWAGLRLVRDQIWLLLLGLGGLAFWWRRGDRTWALFLTGWLLWSLFLLLLPGRTPADLGFFSLPLILGAAPLAAWPWSTAWRSADRQEGLLMAAILVAIGVTGVLWSIQYAKTLAPEAGLNALLSLSLGGLLILFFGWWANWFMAGRVVIALGTGLLLLAGVSTGWQSSAHPEAPGALGYVRTPTDLDVRRLAADVATLSAQRVGDPLTIPVQVQMDPTPDPVLGWYLRGMRDLRWVLAPEVTPAFSRSPLVIAPAGADPQMAPLPSLPEGYIGSAYLIRRSWLPSDLQGLQGYLRWFLYQHPAPDRIREHVVLWVMFN